MTDDDIWQKYIENVKPLPKSSKTRLHDDVAPYKDIVIRKKTGDYVKRILNPVHVNVTQESTDTLHPLAHDVHKTVCVIPQSFFKNKPIQATLDLHGYTQVQAQEALLRFFSRMQKAKHSVVLVITGKGKPDKGCVIKTVTQEWFFKHFEYVVGFSPAYPKDGGAGAFYVHVRRVRSWG